jgi:CheY-like chemotaxis protein
VSPKARHALPIEDAPIIADVTVKGLRGAGPPIVHANSGSKASLPTSIRSGFLSYAKEQGQKAEQSANMPELFCLRFRS